MTWTYLTTLATDRDKVRFWCGDTDTNDQLISDEEITYVLTTVSDVKLAAARILEQLAAKYARKADSAVGDLRISYSQISKRFWDMAQNLNKTHSTPTMYAGGTSETRIDSNEEDSDMVTPSFRISMLDNPNISGNLDLGNTEDDD